jgi:hypothetical protein
VGPQVLYTKKIEIYTGDANFSPWTLVATHTHSTWDNGRTPTFTDDGTTIPREGGGGGSEGDTTRRRPWFEGSCDAGGAGEER